MGAGTDTQVGDDGIDQRPADERQIGLDRKPVFCNRCRHCYRVNKSDHPRYWLCSKSKREPEPWFVCQGILRYPPYQFCAYVNQRGNCPEYDEAPEDQQITFKQKET